MVQRTWTGRVILKGEKRGVNKAFQSAENSIGNVAKRLKGLAGFAAFAAVGAAVVGAGKKIAEFEKSISALSAITGATGKDLDRLTEASKRIGATTTLSASQAAEAFKLMASAKPDLLDNLDALERTTEAAVTLAEAAGLELGPATAALGEALNQFGKGAEDAGRFIDVLAQGARLGSSEIDQTSEALKNAGVVARLAGLSFEETNAAIQGMAAAGVKGSDAGTKLRSVLVKLQTQANDEFNPAVVGINNALDNLAEANLSATEKVALFGEKQVVSAEILIDQRRNIRDLSDELKDSMGAALGQAATRTDNLSGDMKRLGSIFEAVQLNLANNSLPVFRGVIQAFTKILSILDKLTASEGINKADAQMGAFEATLKALFVTGNVIKNLFDIVLETFKGIGRVIGAVMTGSLANVMDAIDQVRVQAVAQVDDMARAVFETYNEEAAQAIRDGEATLVAASNEVLTEIIVNSKQRTITAGEEAAATALALAAVEAEKAKIKEDARIEGIREGFRTERQVIAEEWALKLEQLTELELAGAEIGQTFSEARIAAAMDVAKKLAAIETKGLTTRQKFEMKTTVDKGKFLLGEGMKMTQGVAQQSKTMFKINKTLALANAAATLPSAVIKAIDNGGGLPWGAIPGAITLAAGLAQIQAIKSTTFSGGGGGTTPSLAGSTGSINNVPVGNIGAPGGGPLGLPGTGVDASPGQAITIQIDGLPSAGPVPAEMVRELIDGINEQLGDGVNLDTSAGAGT
jgi:TP901 family phage tail tape measure protein